MPIGIVEQPEPVVAPWTAVECCPVCGSQTVADHARLPDRHYVFEKQAIPMPDSGIAVSRCGVCTAVYKSQVPSPAFLAGIFGQYAEAKWRSSSNDLSPEIRTARRLWGADELDMLDVGAADGALLGAHAAEGLKGRRSAFDVMRYAGLERHLNGEFIEGFLDAPLPAWSGEPYDVVTLFDVMEHLYRPQDAFENLRALTRPGGLVLIETGNSESLCPRRFGINQWWYVRLLEHHVFWSQRSLAYLAAAHGFKIVYWKESQHKSRRHRAIARVLSDTLKVALYYAAGRQYVSIAQALGGQGNQPWFPLVRDHFQACLTRI
jgi:2-polyprenyl-3-methyl-5-hydroxy-6-metoxy-1,4-benzoquinol methylase